MPISVEIKVTVPKEVFKIEAWRRRVEHVQSQKTGPELQALFRKTVTGWDHKPRFYKRKHITAYQIGVIVHPAKEKAGEIYALVNEGAKPHLIRPRTRKFLRFQVGYRSASRPRFIGGRRKTRFGRFISTPLVRHPGFQAREFDSAIAEAYGPTFFKDMQDTFRFGQPKGHG